MKNDNGDTPLHSVLNSYIFNIDIIKLLSHNKEVLVFDQLEFDLNVLNSKIQLANTISDFEKCDLVIVSKEHEEDISSLKQNNQNIIIF
jgi:hypothetical protein